MRVGIVGVGFMGSTHAAGWAETGAELVGCVAETVDEARPLAEQCGLKIYQDVAALLDDVDVIDICTPTHLHAQMILQAAAARKHIICEKPLTRSFVEGQQAIHACQKARVRLLVAHVVRYFPEYALAQQAVAQGQIGKPGIVRLSRGSFRPKKPVGNWFLDETKSGGILMDLMIHDYDYARWIAGEVETVFAKKVSIGRPDASVDYGMAILKHFDGALSHIAGAWAYPPPTFRTHIEIAGDAGLIEFDSDDTSPIRNLIMRTSQGDAPDVGLPSSPTSESPYTTQIKEFYHALVDDAPLRVTAVDGLAAVQIAEAALESARTGRAIRLVRN
jgi:myo-inositol 2-dehydrogenase / D-chiro-inositol 1-dehydrogenase